MWFSQIIDLVSEWAKRFKMAFISDSQIQYHTDVYNVQIRYLMDH